MESMLAFDPGYGNVKLYGADGGLVMQSVVAVAGTEPLSRMAGIRRARPPLLIECKAGSFYVGLGAHGWGRPIESFDFERLGGSPEAVALLYGAFSKCPALAETTTLIVGLPIESLMGDQAEETRKEEGKKTTYIS